PRGEGVAARLCCAGGRSISETVLFPVLPSQTQGIEDTRLVRFCEDDGSMIYHGTYTAFGGGRVRSELLTTSDFRSFDMRVLS
ncbi:glycosidase, partial [Pseudomonas sp. FW306-2-11AD]